MAYSVDLGAAARRHLDAAEKLNKSGRDDVAGYLFGIAAECGVKLMARSVPSCRCDEVFFSHFPVLRTLLRDRLGGRRGQELLRLIQHDAFMNQWDITMRYAPASDVRSKPLQDWANQARQVVSSMGA